MKNIRKYKKKHYYVLHAVFLLQNYIFFYFKTFIFLIQVVPTSPCTYSY